MAIQDLKFTESEFVNEDISSLPDQVVGQAAFLKAKFDNIGKNKVALGKFNDLIDELGENDNGVNAAKLGGQLPSYYIPKRIENGNGTAIQFPDGTMICTKQVTANNMAVTQDAGAPTIFVGETVSLGNWAANFIAVPTANVTFQQSGGQAQILGYTGPTIYGPGNTQIWKLRSAPQSGIFHVVGVGRWK